MRKIGARKIGWIISTLVLLVCILGISFGFAQAGPQNTFLTNLITANAVQAIQAFNTTTTCTTAGTINTPCTTAAISLPISYGDTNYRVSIVPLAPTNFPQVQTITKSANSFTITLNNLSAAAATYTSFDIVVTHL